MRRWGCLLDRFTSTATRDNPSLRFIYTAGTVLMRHPSAEARCGTPWVEMPPEQIAEATGAQFDAGALQALEPLEILRSTTDPGPPSETDERGSVYAVTAPGTTGLAGSPLNIALIWTVTAPVDAVPATLPAAVATRDDCG